MTSDDSAQDAPPPPVVQVVHGRPDADELAAVVAVLAAAGADAEPAGGSAESTLSLWGSHDRRVRGAVHPRPGGWRASALPG